MNRPPNVPGSPGTMVDYILTILTPSQYFDKIIPESWAFMVCYEWGTYIYDSKN